LIYLTRPEGFEPQTLEFEVCFAFKLTQKKIKQNIKSLRAQKVSPEDIRVLLIKAHETSIGRLRPPVDESIAGFEKVLKKTPEMADIYFPMGVSVDKGEQKDNARKNYI